MPLTSQELNEVSSELLEGLTEEEAAIRLARDGPNELVSSTKSGLPTLIGRSLQEPTLLLLVGIAAVYFLLGDPPEAIPMIAAALLVIFITVYQERKTERALEALRNLASPRALVMRSNRRKRIAGKELVRGDLVFLTEGDRVPADAQVLRCRNLFVDESLLTGESMAMQKTIRLKELPTPNEKTFVFSGTLVVRGIGTARVTATGTRTEVGKIGARLQSIDAHPSKLQQETRGLVRGLGSMSLIICVVAAVGYGVSHSDWLAGALAGLTLAISMMPEEFPVVLTIFLALGAWRLSRQNVLTRRVAAIESLGTISSLCVDKTGTLTMNEMAVRSLFCQNHFLEIEDHVLDALAPEFRALIRICVLASSREPIDPMERAFVTLAKRLPSEVDKMEMVKEYPLAPEFMAMSRAWKMKDGSYLVAAKGAPEAVESLCKRPGNPQQQTFQTPVAEMASRGLRVLGVAHARAKDLPEDQRQLPFEFVGLLGLEDPVRKGVPASVAECHQAGIRVVMVTGDYPVTAQQVAKQIGLKNPDRVTTGTEITLLDEQGLRSQAASTNVFARATPEHKLRLVNALQGNGEIVAMTGDGVNDAPALKAADVGLAMGMRGTDVAREAASIVLLDDNFSSIVRGIRQGRHIYDNLRRAMGYVLAVHIPIAGMALLPILFNFPLVLLPLHIVFLEFIIDPSCSITFEAEAEEAGLMNRPPRPVSERMVTLRSMTRSALQGLGIFLIVAAVYLIAVRSAASEPVARTLAFTTLVIGNLALIASNRSWSRSALEMLYTSNKSFWTMTGGVVLTLAAILYVPQLREVFRLAPLSLKGLAIVIVSGALSLIYLELVRIALPSRHQFGTASQPLLNRSQ